MATARSAIVVLLLMSVSSWACPKGDSKWEGNCVVDIKPESAPADTIKPSDEKPPHNATPDYGHPIDIKPEMTVDDEIKAAQDEDARLSAKGKQPQ